MKYCFELYEITDNRGTLFKGYKTIDAESTEEATLSAQESIPSNYKIHQIYI